MWLRMVSLQQPMHKEINAVVGSGEGDNLRIIFTIPSGFAGLLKDHSNVNGVRARVCMCVCVWTLEGRGGDSDVI